MRTGFDAINATNIPASARIVAGYVDGLYAWSAAGWARFPNAVKVRIAVFSSTDDGHVLDVEPGNATPAQSVDWVLMRRKAGVDPTVYMNTSTWATVRSAFQARKVTEPHYWVAQYDGIAVIPAGAVGKQYVDDEALGYDLSVFADYWPGVDPAPIPKENDVSGLPTMYTIDGSTEIWGADGGAYWHIADPKSANAYSAAGAVTVDITAAEHASRQAAFAKVGINVAVSPAA